MLLSAQNANTAIMDVMAVFFVAALCCFKLNTARVALYWQSHALTLLSI
ncbi:hypothetical protein [Pseudoalteromonas sp. R3]|nr:hypothetical protein [Pseudoalteromonas sp. R3]